MFVSRDLVLDLPRSIQNNGTFNIFLILSKNRGDFPLSSSVVKEFKLSRYKLNKTSKYVNLLDGNKYTDLENVSNTENTKPITHLIRHVNIFTLDSQINFLRNDIPGELYYDLT